MNFHPRHGTIIPITRSELKRITDKWGKPAELGELPNNPVLPGFHADPEIVYSNLTGKYYIYSTTDGHPGWGGWYYTAYSSNNLKDWNYEGIVLDLKSDQVSWTDGNAWAPAIEEKRLKTVTVITCTSAVIRKTAAASKSVSLQPTHLPVLSQTWDIQ